MMEMQMTTTPVEYRCPVCRGPATGFEDGEIQCDNRNCIVDEVTPSTRYGKFSESDFVSTDKEGE